MKVVATIPGQYSHDTKFFVEATADELARIAGFHHSHITENERQAGRRDLRVGSEVLVDKRWEHWTTIERKREDLRTAAKLMETTASLLRSDVLHFTDRTRCAPSATASATCSSRA